MTYDYKLRGKLSSIVKLIVFWLVIQSCLHSI